MQSGEPNARILIVDDNPANLLSLRVLLDGGLKLDIIEASSGEEALEHIASDEFAVILLDVLMPGIDGFETARRIRADNRTRDTPIIFLTAGDTDRYDLEKGYSLGAVDFLMKPLLPVSLWVKVQGFVTLFRNERKARLEAQQLRLLVQGTTDYAIFMLDPNGIIMTWNVGAERLSRYTAEEIVGQHFSRFYTEDSVDRGWPEYELKVAEAQGRFEDEGWRVRKDSSKFWANVVITAIRDKSGTLVGFSKITRDMTERKQAEENSRRLLEEATARRVAEENARFIREERERLRVTLESIGDAVISTDAAGRVDFLNPIAEQLTGWRTVDAKGLELPKVFDIVNETTREPVENPALRALQEGVIVGLANHTILISKDGAERPIDDSAAPIRDAEGKVIGSVLVFRDITEKQQNQQALQQSERRLRLALEAGRMFVWDMTVRTDHWDGNGFQKPTEELAPDSIEQSVESFWRSIHPDDRHLVRTSIERARDLESGLDIEFRRIDSDGSIRWISGKGRLFPGSDERPERLIGVGMDVTRHKRSEQTARFLADASAALAAVVDFDVTLQKVASLAVPYFADWVTVDLLESGALRRVAVAHIDPTKVELAREIHQRFPPDLDAPHGVGNVLRTGTAEFVPEITEELLSQSGTNEELAEILRTLGLRSYIGVPLKVRGKAIGVVSFVSAESRHLYDDSDLAVAIDLAHRSANAIENAQLYRELRDIDRRKDEFLATLAHELRNPLAPIRNSLQILKMPQVDDVTAQQVKEMMERQLHHLVRLVDDLLDVARIMRAKIELRRERVDLSTIITRAVEIAQPLIESQRHELRLDLPTEPLPLEVDPVRMTQVVGNLLTNAAKYTEPNGHISISARSDADQAILRVRDTGIGIAPDVLPHVFELFVQADQAATNTQGGLGIGLTLVKSLIEMHGGSVEARSAGMNKGSEFIIRLPLFKHEASSATAEPLSTDTTIPKTGRRVLVVDDNRDAAVSLSILLQMQGHTVDMSHDGPTALERAQEFKPDVVFLDLGMPGMDGYEVARRLRQSSADKAPVLVALTGWGQHQDRARTADLGFDYHLVKPPELVELQAILSSPSTN